MNLRQCFSLGFMGGILSLIGVLFYRRKEYNIINLLGRPGFTLFVSALTLMLFLSVLFSTPIEAIELQAIYFILLIIAGILQISIGGISFLLYPEKIATHLQTPVHFLFQSDIAISYIAVGSMACISGGMREGALPILVFLCIFGWGRAISYIYWKRIYKDTTKERTMQHPDDITNAEVHVQPIPITNICTVELYTNILGPILFFSLYFTAFFISD